MICDLLVGLNAECRVDGNIGEDVYWNEMKNENRKMKIEKIDKFIILVHSAM